MNDSLIEEINSIPGVTDVMTREIVSVNLNGTRFPADIESKKDFDFMRQEGDIGSMAVSYTHLDVYKRQALYGISFDRILQQFILAHQLPMDNLEEVCIPVSYTHLDVYKRQE